MIQQNITIFLGVDYTIIENQRMLLKAATVILFKYNIVWPAF